jgi:putative tryptophan/tyrosine transport system substrate-binding protein
MKRRQFISLGIAPTAWPLAARAQQSAMPIVGFLSARAREESAHLAEAFRVGLAENGYSEGLDVAIEYRWGAASRRDSPSIITASITHSRRSPE